MRPSETNGPSTVFDRVKKKSPVHLALKGDAAGHAPSARAG